MLGPRPDVCAMGLEAQKRKTSKKELDNMRALIARDLADASIAGLSADRRFTPAYNAASNAVSGPPRAPSPLRYVPVDSRMADRAFIAHQPLAACRCRGAIK